MSGDDDAFEYSDNGLKQLLALLKQDEKMPYTRLGILGDKDNRDGGNSNASVGARHEFGIGVPVRSFLRAPVVLKMQSYIDKAGGFDDETLDEIIRDGKLTQLLAKIGIIGELIVADAFDSRGFGDWKESNMTNKKNKQTLVETQQLRDSIISEVVDND